jgi:hypothetical protein
MSQPAATSSQTPKSWPKEIVYLTRPVYSKATSSSVLRLLKSDVPPNSIIVPNGAGPYSAVKISAINDPSHPAHGQYGLFASQRLPPDSFILLYLGYIHDQTDTDPNSDYDLSLDRELGIGVDAAKMGNEARFINDFRGIAPSANAEFRDVWVDVGKGCFEKRMAVYVLSAGKSGKRAKGIGKGEEILVSYGKGFWAERNPQDTEELKGDQKGT